MNAPAAARLKITEIFRSLQGEGDTVGFPTVFVRLTGCPLRCQYCDTTYAFGGGEWMSLDEILGKVRSYGTRHVCVTGGEPLAQANCLPLLQRLCDAGFHVSLETSGALPVDKVDTRVSRVVDVKTPDSGEAHRNLLDQLDLLGRRDQVKFVICSRRDYEWSRELVRARGLADRTMVLFSPSHGQVAARELAEWILADDLPVRLQVQLHKILWGNEPGR
ncbi:MAG TPA: 7-carboxy-7-deazaguanine synthase QueE [Steroidobacteraceae bacterium]|nr:7-carboxy-7-deazaguanine synthase QueE [Steroidobacteraceae bacterium]